MVIENF